MTAVALSTAVLVAAILTLCVTTALTSLALPTMSLWRRRRPTPSGSVAIPEPPVRRAVTGLPARLPTYTPAAPGAIELGPVAGPEPVPPDSPPDPAELRDAEALIEHLLERNPERLAELITLWLNEDEPICDPKERP